MIKKFNEFINEGLFHYGNYEKANMMFVTDLFMSEKEYETYNRGSNEYDEEPILCIYFPTSDLQEIVEGIEFVEYDTNTPVDTKTMIEVEILVRPEQSPFSQMFEISFNFDSEDGVLHAKPKDKNDMVEIANRYHNLHRNSITKIEVEDSDKYIKSTRRDILNYTDSVFTDDAKLWATKNMEGDVFLHIKGTYRDSSSEFVIKPSDGKMTDIFFIAEESYE